MATSRPATPEVVRRLPVDPVVDVLVRVVVERVVLLVTGVSVPARVEAVVELVVGRVVVDPVDAVVATGRGDIDVVGSAATGLVVVLATVGVVVGVSGSSVRDPAGGVVEPSAGTVTSGTAAAGVPTLEPTLARPETGPAVLTGAGRDVAGEDRSAAPPQAANSTAAMP